MTDVWRNTDMDGREVRIYAADGIVRLDLDRPEAHYTPDQARQLSTQILLAVIEAHEQADDGWITAGLDRLIDAVDNPQDGVRCQIGWTDRTLSCMSAATVHVEQGDDLLALCDDHAVLVEGAA